MRLLVHGQIHGLTGRAAELRDLLKEHVDTTSGGDGNVGASAYQSFDADLGEFVLETWWRDDAALRAHYESVGYERYATRVGELLARPSDVQVHYVQRSVTAVGDASLDPSRQG